MLREEYKLSVLRQGAERDIWTYEREVTGRWKNLHNEIQNVCSSSNIITVIKRRSMRCIRHVLYEMHTKVSRKA